MPYSAVLMFRVSRSVKMSPVAMLRIWDAKMMKPEYWTLIWFLLVIFSCLTMIRNSVVAFNFYNALMRA